MDSFFGKLFRRNKKGSERRPETSYSESTYSSLPSELEIKVVLLGDTNTGAKTSFCSRYVNDAFDESAKPTLGPNLISKSISVRGSTVKITVWDIPGQENYLQLAGLYFRNANCIVLGYDITSRESFDAIRQRDYRTMIENYCPNALIMVIGNKYDLESERQVSPEDGRNLAEDCNTSLFFESKIITEL